MASTTIKSTYSLDQETVHQLERMAKRLKISKSAALRRAIRLAARTELPPGEEQLEALEELQQSLADSHKDLRQWEKDSRELRKASSRL